jgi:hypothetical protein
MSSKIDIKKIDKNFSSHLSNDISYRWINPLNVSDISVYGFNWFQKDRRYHRFPQDSDKRMEKLDGSVGVLANNSSGGMLAFWGSIQSLKIRVKLSYMFNMGHMAYTGQAGFDLYMGENFDSLKFYQTANFNFNYNHYEFTFFDRNEALNQLFVLNFPLYASVEEILVGVNEDAEVKKVENLFPNEGKIVFYGTSITQGGCASRPGMSYTQIISRHLGYECLNFGFSGNGKGHIEVAQILSTIENVKMFILDYEANVEFTRLKSTLKPFVAELRKKYPTVPIFIISKIIFSSETHFSKDAEEECMIRSYQEEFVKTCSIFDKNIYYIDGRTLLGDDFNEKTVDGVHPNDYGFASIARTIENKIKEKL